MRKKIKLFASDIDGTLTDGTVFVTEHGELCKQFSHRDGRGFHLLKEKTSVKTMLITSEKEGINYSRAKKLIGLGTLNHFVADVSGKEKANAVNKVCMDLNIDFKEVAFIGDDTNDLELLKVAGIKACPNDAHEDVKEIEDIIICFKKGGKGAVREFIDYLIKEDLCEPK